MDRKQLIKKLKPYWKLYEGTNEVYEHHLAEIERLMSNKLGKELEFFRSDDGICGIGSVDRKFPLIHDEELM